MTLSNKTEQLKLIIQDKNSSNELIQQNIAEYYHLLIKTNDASARQSSMQSLTKLFSLENTASGSLAATLCGSLVENGLPAEYISDEYIQFFKLVLDKATPFLQECHTAVLNMAEDEDKYEVIAKLTEDLQNDLPEALHAFTALDKYYLGGVAIFSSNQQQFMKGKANLNHISKFATYSTGLYWLSKLFEVLFDEPITVIDLVTHQGIIGSISGIVDNYQLQILLMGLSELAPQDQVPLHFLEVAKGIGEQQTDESIPGKWDMCTWQYSQKPDSSHWIWGEGIPSDIPQYQHRRVILLDKPSYSRGLPVQRTFNNLKATIKIEKELAPSEVKQLLEDMKRQA